MVAISYLGPGILMRLHFHITSSCRIFSIRACTLGFGMAGKLAVIVIGKEWFEMSRDLPAIAQDTTA